MHENNSYKYKSHRLTTASPSVQIIHPFSSVELSHVATLINLPLATVERKLSQMILDHRFSGILDQGRGHLVIFDHSEEDTSFSRGAEVIANMGTVRLCSAGNFFLLFWLVSVSLPPLFLQ